MTWAFPYGHPGTDPYTDRTVIGRDGLRTILVPVPDESQAPVIAAELIESDRRAGAARRVRGHRAAVRGPARAAGDPALSRAGPGEPRRAPARRFVHGIPVRGRAVPAGAARLVDDRNRARAGSSGHPTLCSPTLTPVLVRKFGNARVVEAGLALAALAYALFLPLTADGSYWLMLPALLVLGVAFALAYAPRRLPPPTASTGTSRVGSDQREPAERPGMLWRVSGADPDRVRPQHGGADSDRSGHLNFTRDRRSADPYPDIGTFSARTRWDPSSSHQIVTVGDRRIPIARGSPR
jgi:hypothetical protein